LVDWPPLTDIWNTKTVFRDETTDLSKPNAVADSNTFNASPEYFRAAGTALLAGRIFTPRDDMNAPRVAVVNREFARKIYVS
jgi:hypothetical protein